MGHGQTKTNNNLPEGLPKQKATLFLLFSWGGDNGLAVWLISTTAPLYLRATVHWQSRRLGVVQCLAGTNKQDKAANSEKERRAQSPLSGRSGGLLVSLLVVPFHRQTGRILASWFAAFTKRSEAHRERERDNINTERHGVSRSAQCPCSLPPPGPSCTHSAHSSPAFARQFMARIA